MPDWLKAHLSSNKVMGAVVILGFIGSATSLYLNYQRDHPRLLEDVTISAYPEAGVSQTFTVIANQTFEDQNIPLDGHAYDHCTFKNVCLLYDGGGYQLQHVTFKEHWKVCVKEAPLKNLTELQWALQIMRANATHTQKTVVKSSVP